MDPKIMNISQMALGGYQQAGKQLESVAGKLARVSLAVVAATPEDSVDLASSMVELMQAQRIAEANLLAIHTADELSRHTLNVIG